MAVCYTRLSPPSSTQSVLGGCSNVRLTNSSRTESITANKKLSINKRNGSCYLNYNNWRVTGGPVNRSKYNNSKNCSNTEVAEVEDYSSVNTLKSPFEQLKLFFAFTRPYACIGTIFSVASSSLVAAENLSDISLPFLIGLLKAAAAFGCLIIYVNGVNQLFDIDIDKINKPYLPIASGEMTIEAGISITSSFAIMAFAIGISIGSIPLLWGLFSFFLLLSAYSVKLPFLRWKKSAIAAAISILAGYGIVCPAASYLHMQTYVFGRQANFSKTLASGTIILSLFFLVVALFKDIPDIEGDRKFGIRSLTTQLGQKKVFWICVYLLEMVYAFAIIVGATSSYPWSKLVIVISHAILFVILWKQAKSTDLKNESAMQSFYMFIWNLIYAEFLLIPLMR